MAIPKKSLVKRYKEEIGEQEMSPPVYNCAPFAQATGRNTEKYFDKYSSDDIRSPLVLIAKDKEGIMYYSIAKAKAALKDFFRLYWQDSSALQKRLEEFNNISQEIDSIYDKLSYDHVSHNSFLKSKKQVLKARDKTWFLNACVFFTIYFDEKMLGELAQELNIAIPKKKLKLLWKKAISPNFASFEKRRENYLIKLLSEGKNIDGVLEKCQYFKAGYYDVLDLKNLKKEIGKDFSKFFVKNQKQLKAYLKKLSDNEKKKKIKFDLTLEKYNEQENKIINFIQKIMELRDLRKDYIAKMIVIMYRVSKNIIKNAGLPEKLMYLCPIDEILRGKKYLMKNKRELMKRLRGVIFLVSYDGAINYETGNYARNKEYIKKVFLGQVGKKSGQKKAGIISGQTGSSGKVSGKVRIIKNILSDQKKFKKGEILVTGMTRPEFIFLLKKASAVITDEGGITCHAAIVSRELKKPCVIGTKIATQVLKDGDMVEVDADKGVVKIIKHSRIS